MDLLVTRHKGTISWARSKGLDMEVVEHLDSNSINQGDRVFGNLPVNIACQVCDQGGRYFHLCLDTSKQQRGQELDTVELNRLGASFQEFRISAVVE